MDNAASRFYKIFFAIIAAFLLGFMALKRGEAVNPFWLLAVSLSIYVIVFRFFTAQKTFLLCFLYPATSLHNKKYGIRQTAFHFFYRFRFIFSAFLSATPLIGALVSYKIIECQLTPTVFPSLPSTLWILGGIIFSAAVQDILLLNVIKKDSLDSRKPRLLQSIFFFACILLITVIFFVSLLIITNGHSKETDWLFLKVILPLFIITPFFTATPVFLMSFFCRIKKRIQFAHQVILLESCIAMMALITASVISPGIYFAMNTAENIYAKPEHLEAIRAKYPETYTELVEYANEQHQLYAAQALVAQEYAENPAIPENADKSSPQIEAKELLKWAELAQKNQAVSSEARYEDPPISMTYLLSRIRLFFFPERAVKPDEYNQHKNSSSPSR